jgi:hypothetical protein
MEEYTYWREAKQYDQEEADKARKLFLSNTLNTSQKMELYNCSVAGNLDILKTLIEEKKYSLLEECSASGYFWTVLHYAAHYGFENIVNYVLEYYQNHANKKSILNLQSNLGLSPLYICLNSSQPSNKKKNVLELYVKYDAIDFKVCTKDNEDIYDICKKHGLLDYFLSILKED